MRRIAAALLLAACVLGVAGSAHAAPNTRGVMPAGPLHHTQFGTDAGSVVPGPVHHTNFGPAPLTSTFGCQYDVYRGTVSAFGYWRSVWSNGAVTSSTDTTTGRYVSAKVTNNAHTQTAVLHGHTTNGLWQHGVYRTYTDANAKVWLSGHPCTAT